MDGVAEILPEPATGDAACARCPPGHYCPRASAEPVPCPAGTFGNASGLEDAACDGLCGRGTYCEAGSVLPTPCPAGTYGNATGLTTPACSSSCFPDVAEPSVCALAACEEGYFCPAGSTHGRAHECGEGHYCPPGSGAPVPVDAGLYGVGGGGDTTRTGQATCPTCCPDGATECSAARASLYEGLTK